MSTTPGCRYSAEALAAAGLHARAYVGVASTIHVQRILARRADEGGDGRIHTDGGRHRQTGEDPDARERYRGHRWFDDCAEFCELYDQNCFDPAYDSLPIEAFDPIVRRVFAEPRYI